MDTVVIGLVLVILAYLIGSIPFAMINARLFKLQDPRSFGSGNPGATNILRTGNKIAAIFTLVGDTFKGWFAVYMANLILTNVSTNSTYLANGFSYTAGYAWCLALTALAVFLGHIYSAFLKFHGGKGVATALGVLLALQPWLGLLVLVTWLLIAAAFRISSLAAICTAMLTPFYYLFSAFSTLDWHWSFFLAILCISAMLIYRHKKNIQNLLRGTESKFHKKN